MTGYRGRPEASARQRARRRLRALQKAQGYLVCWRCGRVLPDGWPFHTGHVVAHMDGGAGAGNFDAECPRCNLRDGGKRGAKITNSRRVTNPNGLGGYTSPWK